VPFGKKENRMKKKEAAFVGAGNANLILLGVAVLIGN
jgi:hypothetical protein